MIAAYPDVGTRTAAESRCVDRCNRSETAVASYGEIRVGAPACRWCIVDGTGGSVLAVRRTGPSRCKSSRIPALFEAVHARDQSRSRNTVSISFEVRDGDDGRRSFSRVLRRAHDRHIEAVAMMLACDQSRHPHRLHSQLALCRSLVHCSARAVRRRALIIRPSAR